MAENAPKRHKIQSFGTLSKVFVTIICGQPKVTFLCWWCCSVCFRAAPNAQKNQFLGGIIIIQSFCQLHVWTPNTFHGRNMVRRDPVFSSKKHAQGAERALLLWSKWGLRDGRRLVPSQLTYQIYFLLESVPILVPRRMMRIMQLPTVCWKPSFTCLHQFQPRCTRPYLRVWRREGLSSCGIWTQTLRCRPPSATRTMLRAWIRSPRHFHPNCHLMTFRQIEKQWSVVNYRSGLLVLKWFEYCNWRRKRAGVRN